MRHLRVSEAAELLGVSTDTVRRWVDGGKLKPAGHEGALTVDAADLARFAAAQAHTPDLGFARKTSVRNRLAGIVTGVKRDDVMTQVDIQAGPFRVVSVMTTEAVDELELEVGSVVVASMLAASVFVENRD